MRRWPNDTPNPVSPSGDQVATKREALAGSVGASRPFARTTNPAHIRLGVCGAMMWVVLHAPVGR